MLTENTFSPLAMRMRPRTVDSFIGQAHLLGKAKPLYQAIEQGHLHSMILWGPPGTGKTTLAELMAASAGAQVERISAVLAGVKDIRAVVERAQKRRQINNTATLLFVDEVHRFNKAQQDAFLPHVESGIITLIGATTENPSFQLNNALLSRCRVYVLQRLKSEELIAILNQALNDEVNGLGALKLRLDNALKIKIAQFSDGDARQCLNVLEVLSDFSVENEKGDRIIPEAAVNEVLSHSLRRFDNGGEYFYDLISALHKSVRGSDPDAALYWFSRMVDGGCDAHYIARRVVRMASEDIGNADPRALELALNAWQAYERLGSPEGELAIAQAIVYLACTAKSNAMYTAYQSAMKDVKARGTLEVPMHLRNAPTQLMKNLGYGDGYRYAHDEENAYAKGEVYLPKELVGAQYYYPVDRGLEIKIKQKLADLQKEKA